MVCRWGLVGCLVVGRRFRRWRVWIRRVGRRLPAVFGLILMVSHFAVCIIQGVRAYRGGVTRFGGIPFFR